MSIDNEPWGQGMLVEQNVDGKTVFSWMFIKVDEYLG